MPVTFTNNWKNILDSLRNSFRTEFAGTLPVYVGTAPDAGTQYIQLTPTGSALLEYNVTSESREFTINVVYYFAEHNVKKTGLDHVLRYVSRIEALVHDNMAVTLADSSNLYNCRMETMELLPDDEAGVYVVQWEYKCQHTGNIS